MQENKMNNIKYIVGEVLEKIIRELEYDEDISFEEASDKVYKSVLEWCGITYDD